MTPRYALYYTPPRNSRLESAGTHWLGRTPVQFGKIPEQIPEGFFKQEYYQIIESPRWYGFHGTIRAPFELADGITPEMFIRKVHRVCSSHAPFSFPSFSVRCFGGFLALTPTSSYPELHKLHSDCMRKLDNLRAPLSNFDKQRHMEKKLSERQERLLRRFGYPFVMEEYRFHMTLTGKIDDRVRRSYKDKLEAILSPFLNEQVPVQELTVYMQPNRKTPFVEVTRIPLTGTNEE
ncbi:DUF1045 domain-containing protein [Halodesulfovibrio spirochaetisodalis]|uniref:DUF1045 domain-containing protein n=1 Tax=Halodesulfovibrio spirochaetisodalis TaxID=1560234 RepID=UPI000830D4C0|nr:DUF1045 domain-containing protein [Halodesulfovibrio spirochaetisodalis]